MSRFEMFLAFGIFSIDFYGIFHHQNILNKGPTIVPFPYFRLSYFQTGIQVHPGFLFHNNHDTIGWFANHNIFRLSKCFESVFCWSFYPGFCVLKNRHLNFWELFQPQFAFTEKQRKDLRSHWVCATLC